MKEYTFTEARQNLASLLDQAIHDGEVRIKRRDGKVFAIKVLPNKKSPLDVEGIDLGITTPEIIEFISEGRKYFDQTP